MKNIFLRRLLPALIAILTVFSLSGCGETPAKPRDLMAEVPERVICYAGPPAISNEHFAMDFALGLLQNTEAPGKSTLLSPLSVLYALSMTANGAEGETLAEMEKVLGARITDLNHYLSFYHSRIPKEDGYALRLANSIWFADREDYTVEKDFLEKNASFYQAGLYAVPMGPQTADTINHWVKDHTDGMIPAIIDEVPEDTVMYLVNALAFDAEWESPYQQPSVREKLPFYKEDGTESLGTYLTSSEWNYLENEQATGFLKPYRNGKYAFVGLLPREGRTVEDLLASLTGEDLRVLILSPSREEVITAIPKFETESSLTLNDALKALGMPTAFDPDTADFSALGHSADPMESTYMSRVLHRTYLSLGEKGTRAGAATVVEMDKSTAMCPEEPPRQVELNRPFLYLVVDAENALPLFIGTMMNPF